LIRLLNVLRQITEKSKGGRSCRDLSYVFDLNMFAS
jgi:hypothetical protein